ncbi:hypothetical protein PNK_1414 [Candidatus Protochlamydia naegleriophila]|uniref:Uncharacterized protein n=1 Tax=Candidatus Protochlamydia naegleriophila TaxID=389348 RepID=A0A0U5ES54_9BACT|nr:hypothetical protein PNK_1414 [Candidatus Protochlamydia naegleriophila]
MAEFDTIKQCRIEKIKAFQIQWENETRVVHFN